MNIAAAVLMLPVLIVLLKSCGWAVMSRVDGATWAWRYVEGCGGGGIGGGWRMGGRERD